VKEKEQYDGWKEGKRKEYRLNEKERKEGEEDKN
jgi:hypothetical protein